MAIKGTGQFTNVITDVTAGGASGLMSGSDKTKLDGIASGAEVNVQSDWNATEGDAFIQNKPTLGTAAALDSGTDVGDVVIVGADGKIDSSLYTAGSGEGGFSTLVQRSLEGVVYETALMYWVAPATCTINSVSMNLSSNPSATGSYCKVQAMKNGLLETDSIFSADTPMQITELTSATNGIYQASGTLDTGNNMDDLAAGDVVHFKVNQADTGSADLLVQMKVTFV